MTIQITFSFDTPGDARTFLDYQTKEQRLATGAVGHTVEETAPSIPDPGASAGAEISAIPGLSSRAANGIIRKGIHTVAQLWTHTEKELTSLDGVGAKAIVSIKEFLATQGLSLAQPGSGYESMTPKEVIKAAQGSMTDEEVVAGGAALQAKADAKKEEDLFATGDENPEKTYTLVDVKAACMTVNELDDGLAKITGIWSDLGIGRFRDITPEQFAPCVAACEKVLADAVSS